MATIGSSVSANERGSIHALWGKQTGRQLRWPSSQPALVSL